MKIKKIKTVEVSDVDINISFKLSGKCGYYVSYSYTCPECSGYGCRSHGGSGGNPDCSGGEVTDEVNLADLDNVFGKEATARFRKVILDLHSKMNQSL